MLRTKMSYAFVVIAIISSLFAFAVTEPVFAQNSLVRDTPIQDDSQDPSQDTLKPVAPQDPPVQAAKEEIDVAQPAEKKIDLPTVEVPEEIYQLKKIDPNRIGVESSYTTFGGFRPIDYIMKSPALGVGQRVEIYQEPKPIDAYITMFKEMQHTYSDFHNYWIGNHSEFQPVDFRTIVQPLFVRAYGTEFTLSDPKESSQDIKGQIRYTIDYRDVYKEYYPKFVDLKVSRWLQNDIMFITTAKIQPINWLYTSNVGYRYSNVDYKSIDPRFNFHSAPEMRSTYYINQALAPNPRFEVFLQGEYFKSNHFDCDWANSPDHYFAAGELRLKSKDMKTSYTGRFSYSLDIYSPFSNTYEKYEIWARVGHDFNDRLNAYTMLKYVYGHTHSEDNGNFLVPPGWDGSAPLPFPFDVTAIALTWENRAQYRVYDKLWVQGGLDLATGINMSDFDNIGWLAGLEYYAPGIIRVDVGWRGNHFYNIDDFLTTIYFKCYFFM